LSLDVQISTVGCGEAQLWSGAEVFGSIPKAMLVPGVFVVLVLARLISVGTRLGLRQDQLPPLPPHDERSHLDDE
jgi:hypothetical protein